MMAKATAKTEVAKETVPEKKPDHPEDTLYGDGLYGVSDLAAASRTFGTQPECVIAAFKTAGKDRATVPEARRIVSEFLKQEVK